MQWQREGSKAWLSSPLTIASARAQAAGKPEPEIIKYNPKEFDFGKRKAFPFRDQHFFASCDKAMIELGWEPKFDLVAGLKDSWDKDFSKGRVLEEADFSCDGEGRGVLALCCASLGERTGSARCLQMRSSPRPRGRLPSTPKTPVLLAHVNTL